MSSENVEEVISLLNTEISFFKNEQNMLKTEIRKLVEENREMGCKLESMNKKCWNTANMEAEIEERDTIITNLKQQIFLAVKEKESLNNMWVHANKTVDIMENDLKNMQDKGFSTKEHLNIKKEYTAIINILEMKIVEYKEKFLSQQKISVEAETKVKHLTSKLEDFSVQFERIQRQMSSDLIAAIDKSKSLEKELSTLRSIHSDLEEALQQCQLTIKKVEAREEEAKIASLNAIQLAENGRKQLEEVVQREKLAVEEQKIMRNALASLISESEEKVKTQIEEIKQTYHENSQKHILNVKKLELDLEEKEHALGKALRMEEHLRAELDEIRDLTQHNFSNKVLELEKKFEDTFQKLILSERVCSQLTNDKEAMRQDVKRMMEGFELDLMTRDRTTQLLIADLKTLRAHLTVTEESEKHLKFVVSKLEEHNRKTEEASYKTNCDLQKQLKNQQILNNKWKISIREIVEKLQSRITEQRNDNHLLKKLNKQLMKEIQQYKN